MDAIKDYLTRHPKEAKIYAEEWADVLKKDPYLLGFHNERVLKEALRARKLKVKDEVITYGPLALEFGLAKGTFPREKHENLKKKKKEREKEAHRNGFNQNKEDLVEIEMPHEEMKKDPLWEATRNEVLEQWKKETGKNEASREYEEYYAEKLDKDTANAFRSLYPDKGKEYDKKEAQKIYSEPRKDAVYNQVNEASKKFSGKRLGLKSPRKSEKRNIFQKVWRFFTDKFPVKATAYSPWNPYIRKALLDMRLETSVRHIPSRPEQITVPPIQIRGEPVRRRQKNFVDRANDTYSNLRSAARLGRGAGRLGAQAARIGARVAATAVRAALMSGPVGWLIIGILIAVFIIIIVVVIVLGGGSAPASQAGLEPPPPTSGGTIGSTGRTCRENAQLILDSPGVTKQEDSCSRAGVKETSPLAQLRSLASNDSCSYTTMATCSCIQGTQTTGAHEGLIEGLSVLAESCNYVITSLGGGKHGCNSRHYQGQAVDIGHDETMSCTRENLQNSFCGRGLHVLNKRSQNHYHIGTDTSRDFPDLCEGFVPPTASQGSGNEPPSDDDCNGQWTRDIEGNPLRKNFGDPVCTFDKDKLFSLLQELDPQFANEWFAMMSQESSYRPNAFNPVSTSGTAWGLLQMGHEAYPELNIPRQMNTEYDRGDVAWQKQISNAINYNNARGKDFCYWAAAGPLGLRRNC